MQNEQRLIAYDAVYQYAFEGIHGGGLEDEDFAAIVKAIDAVPTVDAVEVVHARKAESAISETGLMCTACHSDIDRDAVFCKYCGAKMDGGNEDV